jgi:hypothetical protein
LGYKVYLIDIVKRSTMKLSNTDRAIHSLRQLGIVIALSEGREVREALFIATQLTIHGLSNHARKFIEMTKQSTQNRHALNYLIWLEKICANVEAHDVWNKIHQKNNIFRQVLGFNSIYVPRRKNGQLIIVFATSYNNFGISFPLLHSMLERSSGSILYLKNPDLGMYCTGSPSIGNNIDNMGQSLKNFCRANGFSKVSVLGFSSSGYASLFAAGCIGASSYTGFGIRTDWSPSCPCPISPRRSAPEPEDYNTNTLMDLRLNKMMERIGRAQLYYGMSDSIDSYQAENMRGLPNFEILPIEHSEHNVILSLTAENKIESALQAIT